MGYAVLHSEKGKGGSGGIGNHIDRQKGMEHTYPHADSSRFAENKVFTLHQDRQKVSLSNAINSRIEEGYKGKRAIRKDAVKFTTHILTGSHKEMKEIFKDSEKSKAWIQANYDFVAKEFGKENIVRFNLHLDEKTPHIHAVTVPLTKDGRLSAREQFGNKTELRNRQDRYAQAMKPFNLERGERRTGIKHENANEYYYRMETANKISGNTDDLTMNKSVLGINVGVDKKKTIQSLKTAVNAQRTALKSKELELKQVEARLKDSKDRATSTSLRYDNIILNDEKYKVAQEQRIKTIQKQVEVAIKSKISNTWNWYGKSAEERNNTINKAASEKAKELKLDLATYKKVVNHNNFGSELITALEKKVEEKQNRDQNRGRRM